MKYFSTDGLRGRVGDNLINPSFFVRLGWAIARALPAREGANRHNRIIIGKDTRISGYMLETALQAGIISAGPNVQLLGPIPTPGVAYLTHILKASMGIMITASHNPYYDNGVKIFNESGHKISDATILAIEKNLEISKHVVTDSIQLGKVTRIQEANGRYIEHCRQTAPNNLDLNGLKLVVDCAHGSTYRVAPNIFKEMGADVKAVNVEPDGININDNCGSTNPQRARHEVLDNKADLGISFDGDGDRLLLIDRRGRILDGDRLLYVIATDMLERGNGCDGVVGTIMSNTGLEHAFAQKNIPFARAPVGDLRVWQMMRKLKWSLGGEPSGHIICMDRGPTGDGMVAALRILEAMQFAKRDLGDWAYEVEYFEQAHRNIRIKSAVKDSIKNNSKVLENNKDVRSLLAKIKKTLKPSRVVLRPSGTESLIRLMVEAQDGKEANKWADELADAIKNTLL